ncbi:methanol/ethanol family PQQ-dependent dehydrogenase [Thiohalorhabdus methylotrophus]|uniref:Methanol/ethanol family PQQ-dependent dehydrogenase n=1 Tax=Thiohalorhabdus methylotrophus TaxID=3242694 RepID=A0ABV4TXZ2_9GAMM
MGRLTHRSVYKGSMALLAVSLSAYAGTATANEKLQELAKSEKNWVMQCKSYDCQHFSESTQINASNVENLEPAWSFSTGVLSGHEGAPLVVNGMMYIHSPYPNKVFAVDLDNPNKIVWQYEPKQDPAARSVACCDVVNRGLAYYPGEGDTPPLIIESTLDGHLLALNANNGEMYWKLEVMDPSVGQTLTQSPYVVKDKVIIGSSGAELGVRGVVTAYDIKTGEQDWRAYATGPDKDLLLADDFNSANPQYGQEGLGLKTWEGNQWKVGGGTNWGWYAYDPEEELVYYGAGNAAPWNETMRPGDNKWTNTIFARDVDSGKAEFAYQKTPHDEWDYAGVNVMMLSEQKVDGETKKLLTHPDRNGILYSLDRTNGDLVAADKMDDTVNWVEHVNLDTGTPVRDPEYGTRMGHKTKGICPSAMGYHNQGVDSYDPDKELFFIGMNHLCMDWEPYMLPYRAGQFFVGANVWTYPGPKGNREESTGSGQIKAYDVKTGEFKWSKMERFAVWGGTTATAGNLVFYGTLDGFIKARDSRTGELLWKYKLPSGVIGHPITYKHDGTQYVGINYGVGGWPGVGLVFDLEDPSAGLGAVNAFKKLQEHTQMGGGFMAFSLEGDTPFDNVDVGEYQASN